MQTHHGLSARRADRTLGLSRSARHYRPRRRDDGPLIAAIEAHLKDNPGHGFGLLFDQALRPQGFGKTRSWRVYVALKLNLLGQRTAIRPPEDSGDHYFEAISDGNQRY